MLYKPDRLPALCKRSDILDYSLHKKHALTLLNIKQLRTVIDIYIIAITEDLQIPNLCSILSITYNLQHVSLQQPIYNQTEIPLHSTEVPVHLNHIVLLPLTLDVSMYIVKLRHLSPSLHDVVNMKMC